MLRNAFMALGLIIFLSGCVTAKTYVINKPRVDQEIPGMPQQGPVKTRKVVVVEVIEKDKAGAVQVVAPVVASVVVPAVDHDSDGVVEPKVTAEEKDFSLPKSAVPQVKAEPVLVIPQEYVVVKDDTLQKISKKVYGTYGKWTKIYDANRDVLKDPNFLKSGVKLKIPSLDAIEEPAVKGAL
ncbi:MAG: LysM peptidoglycan-binding domain-containing protein [Candidatus Omnitrophota bacterium]